MDMNEEDEWVSIQDKHVDVIAVVREGLRTWTDPDVLIDLILELRHTTCLHDDAIRAVLTHLRYISLADALRMTRARAVVLSYSFPRNNVFPSPESACANFYYVSQVVGQDGQIAITARSHWRGTDGEDLRYVVSIELADVSMSLTADRENVKMDVPRVQLVTNALSHGELRKDFLDTISRLRLAAAFNVTGNMLRVDDADPSSAYGFGMHIVYETLCE